MKEYIINLVLTTYKVSYHRVFSKDQRIKYLTPRQVITFLLHKFGVMSFPELGEMFFQSHTTAINSRDRIESECEKDLDLQQKVDFFIEQILNHKKQAA